MDGLIPPLRAARNWGSACLDFLYPRVCPLCYRRLSNEDKSICAHCTGAMRLRDGWRCPRCGAAGRGAEPESGKRCRLCPPEDAAWHGAFAATGYSEIAARCVHLFKYHRRRELGEAMAAIMRRELEESFDPLKGRLDFVAPVPIHLFRRINRGFNQSDLLAEALGEMLEIPCRRDLLRRVKHTTRQALLPREKRADNVRDAFAIRKTAIEGAGIEGTGVLLVDDVVTSGETIGECARALRNAGVREIWVACFARAGAGTADDFDDNWAPEAK